MKYLKIGIYELLALLLICMAAALRLLLIVWGWPATNSDEATIGLMARHIAYQHDFPIFFYGQDYMGALEAYLGALFFQVFGPSLLALHAAMVFLFTLFLASTYLLGRLLYSRGLALFSLFVLSLGSSYMIARPLSAIGGYGETLLLGSLLCVLATALSLSKTSGTFSRSSLCWRLVGFFSWGLCAGLGLWSDLLIAPFVACSGLLLLICCWPEFLRILAPLFLLLGLLIGAYPLLAYNLHAAPGLDSWSIFLRLHSAGKIDQPFLLSLWEQLNATFEISLPMMTGNPFCPVSEIPFLSPTSSPSWQCTLIHTSWSSGYLLLLACSCTMTLLLLWKHYRQSLSIQDVETRRLLARTLLLLGALLTLASFTFSTAPLTWPGIHARYLIGLLIVIPALLWPLWHCISSDLSSPKSLISRLQIHSAQICLVIIAILFLVGPLLTMLNDVPPARDDVRQQQALIHGLLHIGARHVYTDYWTCNTTAFLTNEQIICAVVDQNLMPTHNRVPGYYETVLADPASVYAWRLTDHLPGMDRLLAQPKHHFRHFILAGYNVYQPRL